MRFSALIVLTLGASLSSGAAAPQDVSGKQAVAAANRAADNRVVAVHYLVPVLLNAGTGAVIYYRGACSNLGPILFPNVIVQPPSAGATGLNAIRDIYRNNPNTRVTLGPRGIFRIEIGSVPKRILKARLAYANFDEDAQFNPFLATLDLFNGDYFRLAEKKLDVHQPLTVVDVLSGGHESDSPHLPVTLRNMSVEQILDVMAKTWKGIALYGVSCYDPKEYDIWYTGGINYDDSGDWHPSAN